MYNHTNVKQMYVSLRDNAAASTSTTVKSPSDLRLGEIALVATNSTVVPVGTRITTGLTQNQLNAGVKLVQNDNGSLKYSPLINAKTLYNVISKVYSPFIRETAFLGWNGTSGDITVDNNTFYNLRVRFKEAQTGQYDTVSVASGQTSDASATSAQIADNQVLQMYKMTNDPRKVPVKVSRVGNADALLINPSVAGILVKLNAKSATVNVLTGLLAASTATVVDQQYLSIPSEAGNTFTITPTAAVGFIYIGTQAYAGTSAATYAAAINAGTQAVAVVTGGTGLTITVTNTTEVLPPFQIVTATPTVPVLSAIAAGDATPVIYRVSGSVTAGNSFQLDAPWQGSTAYAVLGIANGTTVGNTTSVISAGAYADPIAFGVKIVGIHKIYAPNKIIFEGTDFSLEAQGYSTTPITYAVNPNPGSGDWGQVTDALIWNQQYAANGMRFQNDRYSTIEFAAQSEVYDMYTLFLHAGDRAGTILNAPGLDTEIVVAIPNSNHDVATDPNTVLAAVLLPLINGTIPLG